MDITEALEFIHTANKFGSKLGLDNIQALLSRLGNPQNGLRFVHIAGTNGKGSTASFVESILRHAGYRTGLYTSPFVFCFNERIRVEGENIPDDDLAQVVTHVKKVIDQMVQAGEAHPTEFEIITAAAFVYFAEKKCDIVVLEVGLGGRFDATNVIKKPEVSVICSIGLDHVQYLGDTYSQIAMEKCGIVKPDGITVCYPVQQPLAMQTIRSICSERSNELVIPDLDRLQVHQCGLDGSVFDYGPYEGLRIRLVGRHQIYNCLTALMAIEQLRQFPVSKDAIAAGLSAAQWKGRIDKISEAPPVYVDGAHNPDGMRSLAAAVRELMTGQRIVLVFGMLADKEYEECIREIGPLVDEVIFTTVNIPRAASASELLHAGARYCRHAEAVESVADAVRRAVEKCDGGTVIAAGSLYMLADVNQTLQ